MDFKCKQLSITDDPDFGCTIEFSDSVDKYNESLSIQVLTNPSEKYLMIQRSYPEDEFENDWYTIESSVADIEFNQKDKMYVKLSHSNFEIYCSGITLIIGLDLSAGEYSKLNKALKTRFKDKVVIIQE